MKRSKILSFTLTLALIAGGLALSFGPSSYNAVAALEPTLNLKQTDGNSFVVDAEAGDGDPIPGGAAILCAAYALDGRMLAVRAAVYDGMTATFQFSNEKAKTVKAFFVMQEGAPLCVAQTLENVTITPPVSASQVYFTSDISSDGLMAVYEALGWEPRGKVAVKVSTGEPPASNYLRPELIADLVQEVDGTIVECNTAYGGSRASSAMHKQVAADHGFTAIADFDLMDEDGEVQWPVTGGDRLDHILVGSHAENYSDWLILSHYKGHAMAGFGGAIKNVGIGASSANGKVLVHTAGTRSSGSIWYSNQEAWLEALAEMVDGFVDHVGEEHIVYVNVMNRLSVDCDCNGRPAEPDIHDIGILASTDPVALDQACYDLVSKAEGNTALMNRIQRQNGLHTLEHAEEIGLGDRAYTLVSID